MGSRRLERLEGPVAVCTVTYGSRASFLARVLEAVNAQTAVDYIQAVVICDNGSSIATKAFLRETSKADSRLRVITLPTNRGSAVGFGEAMRIAAFMASFVWCLDDDNVPDPTALEKLIEAHAVLPKPHALLSLRVDREEYVALSYTGALQQLTGRPGSFLRFDVVDYVRHTFHGRAVGRRSDAVPLATAPIRVPYGPYGGLFFESEVVRTVGLPRAEFFLYGDDHEFTLRVTRSGYPIYLVPESKIRDIEASWNRRRPKPRWMSGLITDDGSGHKAYYAVRNRVYLESRYLVRRSWARYVINVVTYIVALLVQSVMLSLRRKSVSPFFTFLLVVRAVADGLAGRMGKLAGLSFRSTMGAR